MRHLLPHYLPLYIWYCPICSRSFRNKTPCPGCLKKLTPAPEDSNALFLYDEISRKLIYGFKYENVLGILYGLARECVPRINDSTNLISWVPASRTQISKRGYDQSQFLVRAISKITAIPVRRLLRRRNDIPQTHKIDTQSRRMGPDLCPCASKVDLSQKRVLLVDDVITTGTSMRKAQNIIYEMGAKRVDILAIATAGIGS